MLKQKFLVHDGRSVKFLLVSEHMIGFKAGEFTFTRKMGVSHKKKKIKKGKKK
jgi:ribosomal protein S19